MYYHMDDGCVAQALDGILVCQMNEFPRTVLPLLLSRLLPLPFHPQRDQIRGRDGMGCFDVDV